MLKKYRRNIRYKHRILMLMFLMVLIIIIVFCTFVYTDYMRTVRHRSEIEISRDIDNKKQAFDAQLGRIYRYYVSCTSKDEIRWFLEDDVDYSDYSKIVAVKNTLSGSSILSDDINGYAIVNYRNGWILSNKGMYRLEELGNKAEIDALYQQKFAFADKSFWTHTAAGHVSSEDKDWRTYIDTSGIDLIIRFPQASVETYCIIVINISDDFISDHFSADGIEDGCIAVIDSDNNILYASDAAFASAVLEQRADDNSIESKLMLGRKQLSAAYTKSDVLNWNIYAAQDISVIKSSETEFYLSAAFIIMMVIVLIFSISTYLLYAPISRLLQQVNGEGKESSLDAQGLGDDLKQIAIKVEKLEDNNTKLGELVEEKQRQGLELVLVKMLRGAALNEELFQMLMEQKKKAKGCYVCLSMIFQVEDEDGIDEKRESAIYLLTVKKLKDFEEKQKDFLLFPVIYYQRAIVCVISENNHRELMYRLMDVFRHIREIGEAAAGYELRGGVSAIHEDIEELGKAYSESVMALNASGDSENGNAYGGPSDCRLYIQQNIRREGNYEAKYESDIYRAVMVMDKQQAYDVTNEFIYFLSHEKMSHNDTVVYLLQYVNAVIKAAGENKLDERELFGDELLTVYQNIIMFYDLERIRKTIKSRIIDPVFASLSLLYEKRSYIVLEQIKKLIEDKNGNITLAECAQELNYHQTYIWKILKEEENKSFTDYLADYRISRSKYLLENTSMTVAEIAQQLGYTNAQNFIRFFSKYTGMTPGKYRQNIHINEI